MFNNKGETVCIKCVVSKLNINGILDSLSYTSFQCTVGGDICKNHVSADKEMRDTQFIFDFYLLNGTGVWTPLFLLTSFLSSP